MSKVSLTLPLSETFVSRGEVNTLFNDFLVKINTTKLDFDQFRYKSMRYRHLSKPPVRFLWDEKVGAAIGGALPGGGAWLTAACEVVNVVHTAGYDPGTGAHAAVYVQYEATDWEDNAYEIAVGYRHSGTWYSLEGTERTLGWTHTHENGSAYSGTVNHYYTGVGGWRPTGAFNHPVITSCGVVSATHIRAGHSVQNIDRYALLLRMNSGSLHGSLNPGSKAIDAFDRARIWAIVKDST